MYDDNSQQWTGPTGDGLIKYKHKNTQGQDMCIDAGAQASTPNKRYLLLWICNNANPRQKWVYVSNFKQIKFVDSGSSTVPGLCIEYSPSTGPHGEKGTLILNKCTSSSYQQFIGWNDYQWKLESQNLCFDVDTFDPIEKDPIYMATCIV